MFRSARSLVLIRQLTDYYTDLMDAMASHHFSRSAYILKLSIEKNRVIKNETRLADDKIRNSSHKAENKENKNLVRNELEMHTHQISPKTKCRKWLNFTQECKPLTFRNKIRKTVEQDFISQQLNTVQDVSPLLQFNEVQGESQPQVRS